MAKYFPSCTVGDEFNDSRGGRDNNRGATKITITNES